MPVHRSSRGQATPLWAVVLLLAALLLVPTGALVRAAVDRAAARSAADAAALAGAAAGAADARRVASANGARLTDYAEHGDVVEVTVRVGDRQATARAERTLVPAGEHRRRSGTLAPEADGLDPAGASTSRRVRDVVGR